MHSIIVGHQCAPLGNQWQLSSNHQKQIVKTNDKLQSTRSSKVIHWVQCAARKSEKDKDAKDSKEEVSNVKKDEETDDSDDEGAGMKKKEEAEAVEVRDVSYNLESLV